MLKSKFSLSRHFEYANEQITYHLWLWGSSTNTVGGGGGDSIAFFFFFCFRFPSSLGALFVSTTNFKMNMNFLHQFI
jgi:hypothetical protein